MLLSMYRHHSIHVEQCSGDSGRSWRLSLDVLEMCQVAVNTIIVQTCKGSLPAGLSPNSIYPKLVALYGVQRVQDKLFTCRWSWGIFAFLEAPTSQLETTYVPQPATQRIDASLHAYLCPGRIWSMLALHVTPRFLHQGSIFVFFPLLRTKYFLRKYFVFAHRITRLLFSILFLTLFCVTYGVFEAYTYIHTYVRTYPVFLRS